MAALDLSSGTSFAAERLHSTVPVLANGKTDSGRCSVYCATTEHSAGRPPPATMFYCSCNRGGEHPARHLAGYAGILQADAYAGFAEI